MTVISYCPAWPPCATVHTHTTRSKIRIRHCVIFTFIHINDLNIYPNPNTGRFQIAIKTNVQEDVQLALYDMVGQQVWLGSPVSVGIGYIGSVDVASLSSGLYILQIKTQDGVESRKIEIK